MSLGSGQIWIIIRNVIIVLASLYILFMLAMFLFQSRLVFIPQKELTMTPQSIGIPYEDVYFMTDDGTRLNGWFIPSDSSDCTVLFCHGNAGNISHRLEIIEILNELRLNVFIFDYRGYGKSVGKPSEEGTYRDADAGWGYLIRSRNIDPLSIILFGKSLGGAVAADLASGKSAAGLILESSFTSAKDLGSEIYPFLPVRFLSRFDFNTLGKIDKIDCPKLIVHSRDDEIIPFSHGEELFNAAKEPKDFLEISGTHNEGFLINLHKYRNALGSFINRISRCRD
jgi:fermentation-respiration switch protein FrsA (DUF1100 family)